MRDHAYGCTCRRHVDRPWHRPEHWRPDEIDYLESWFGRKSDEAIARHLGRTAVGVRLKAKRIGLHKRTAGGLTAREVAKVFGVDATTVAKAWIRRGLLPAHATREARVRRGRPVFWIVRPGDVEAFIRDHPEHVDVDKMPESPYRDLAARDPWISLPEVHRRTGRDHHTVAVQIIAGEIEGRRRGTHWYIPERELARVQPLRTPEAIDESVFRRQSVLEVRRNRRKGLAA